VSATWPARVVDDQELVDQRRQRVRFRHHRCESGARAIDILEQHHADAHEWAVVEAKVEGLPWGQRLDVSLQTRPDATHGTLMLRLPLALGEAVVTRLAAVPGLQRR
jgi:hypothetical protein